MKTFKQYIEAMYQTAGSINSDYNKYLNIFTKNGKIPMEQLTPDQKAALEKHKQNDIARMKKQSWK